MRRVIVGACAAALFLSACATSAGNVHASYVSPDRYQDYSCDAIHAQLKEVADKVQLIAAREDRDHKRDVVAVTVGAIVFWPALFMLAGGSHASELADLKGQYEALSDEATRKHCPPDTASVAGNPSATH
jgi:hypothetical protein